MVCILGTYRVIAFKDRDSEAEIMAIAWGRPEGRSLVPVRVHDQCFTAEVLGTAALFCLSHASSMFAMCCCSHSVRLVWYVCQAP